MLRSKQHLKITKKGSLQKVVREHYLREDIPCGVRECAVCCNLEQHNGWITTQKPILIVDTNVLLHQIDIVEHEAFKNAVFPSVVLEEVKNRNLKIYSRIRELIKTRGSEKGLHVFSNEFHQATFIDQSSDLPADSLSSNDRNDKAIRAVASFYRDHLKQVSPNVTVHLVSDDVANRKIAEASGISALSVESFVKAHQSQYPEMSDMLADPGNEAICNNEKHSYEPHLTSNLVAAKLKSKQLYEGVLTVSPYNCLEASVFASVGSPDKEQTQLFIYGRDQMNRAIHGDRVAVELLPEDQWRVEADADALVDSDEEATSKSDEAAVAVSKGANRKPTAKVVAITKPNKRDFCGSIDQRCVSSINLSSTNVQTVLFTPMDRRIPKIRMQTRNLEKLLKKRIIVRIDLWNESSKYPLGHYVKELGVCGELGTETDALLFEHDIAHAPFTTSVLNCLPAAQWAPSEDDYKVRADFRDLPVCSIDPPGCTDIDDALHARPITDGPFRGFWEIGVHIADVTHFVAPNTPMDDEASRRGTSVYLVDRRIDMLPELLGSNLCSLHSNVERFAFSVLWVMDSSAKIHQTTFTKSIIKSKASFTYDQAQNLLDNPKENDVLSKGVTQLNEFAKIMRKNRMEAGALTLSSPEVKFKLSEETKDPLDVEVKSVLEANSLVEEFMLLANVTVATKIYDSFPESAVLRKHPVPPQSNFDALKGALLEYGLELDSQTNKTLGQSLDRAHVPADPYFNTLVRIMTTRCMMQAVYFASGSTPFQEFKHYGLAMDIYTHFTSPIRRYADVMVHRLLNAAIGNISAYSDSLSQTRIEEVCENLNFRHRMAQYAARSSIELYTHIFFKSQLQSKSIPNKEEAYVVKITKNGFVAFIPKYGIEANVVLADSVKEICVYDADHFCYTKLGNPWIKLFQKVPVCIQIDDTNSRNKIILTLCDDFE